MQIRSEVTDYEGSATSGVDGEKGRDVEYIYSYFLLENVVSEFFSFFFSSRSLSFFFATRLYRN